MVRLLFTLLILGGMAIGVALYVPPVNGYTQQFLGEQTAKRHIANHQWNEAETTLSPLVDAYPDNAELGLLYAKTLIHQQYNQSQTDKTTDTQKNINTLFSRLRETFPQHTAITLAYAQWLAKETQTRNQAVSLYRGLLANGTESPEVLNALGNTFLQAAQAESQPDTRNWLMQWAYYYYETAVYNQPNQFAPRFRMGVIQQQLAGRVPNIRPQVALAQAARNYCNAALIKPNHPETRFNLGLTLMNAHAVDAGTTQLNLAIKLLIDNDQIPKAQELSQQAQSIKTSLFYANPSEKTTPAQLDEWLGQCMEDPRLAVMPSSEAKDGDSAEKQKKPTL